MDTTSYQNTKCKDNNTYYYNIGGKYPESSTSILKEVQLFLKDNQENFIGSGYITFRFKIDCEGKLMQRVQVLQTDEKYKSYHFDKGLVNELFVFLKTLNKWKIAKARNGETLLYNAFLSFKIKNGKVNNLIP
jgi:hypothetical protein